MERIAQLEEANVAKERRIAELEARLAKYENAHVPSSLVERPLRSSKKNGELGRPAGYEGSTRPTPVPEETIEVRLEECPRCHVALGEPVRVESRVVEEIPMPEPVRVTEYLVAHYDCPSCGERVVARHSGCPREGRLGSRALAHIALLKYDCRLPHRRICGVLEREYGLVITPATVLDVTRRVSDALKEEYEAIKARIRAASVVYVDETSIRVDGSKYWIWVFTTETDTLIVIRHSRGKKVLREVLGKKRYSGIIVCDGHRSYSNYTSRLQRCWAHLLREAEFLAEKDPEAEKLNKALHRLYKRLTDATKEEPPPGERKRLQGNAQAALEYWLDKEYRAEKTRKYIEKVGNAERHLLTFLLNPGVEPTNNRAERALREHVVIRKIIGTLRNEKGTRIHETIMSCLATWKQQNKDPYEEIIKRVS